MKTFLRPASLIVAASFLGAALLLIIKPAGLSPAALEVAALGLVVTACFATGALPEHVTAIGFFLVAMLAGIQPAPVVFSGFASPAVWLVFGGMVLGAAVRHTGLGARVAGRMAAWFGGTWWGMVGGTALISTLLGFFLPSSMGRVLLLLPVVIALAERVGLKPGDKGRTALILAAVFGSHVPTFAILPANVPNLVFLGAAERLLNIRVHYGEYLLLHFPVLGLGKALLTLGLIRLFWYQPLAASPRSDVPAAAPPWSGAERRLALLLITALGLWMSDVVHGISPAWVGLGVAFLCLLPGSGMLPAQGFDKISFASIFYVAGIIGFGAVIGASGLGTVLAGMLLDGFPLVPGENGRNFAILAALATLAGPVTTLPGIPAVLMPIVPDLTRATGLPVLSVLMTQVLGFSTVLLPYVSAPMVVGMQVGGERMGHAIRLCLALSAVTILILFPLDYLWWKLLGYL